MNISTKTSGLFSADGKVSHPSLQKSFPSRKFPFREGAVIFLSSKGRWLWHLGPHFFGSATFLSVVWKQGFLCQVVGFRKGTVVFEVGVWIRGFEDCMIVWGEGEISMAPLLWRLRLGFHNFFFFPLFSDCLLMAVELWLWTSILLSSSSETWLSICLLGNSSCCCFCYCFNWCCCCSICSCCFGSGCYCSCRFLAEEFEVTQVQLDFRFFFTTSDPPTLTMEYFTVFLFLFSELSLCCSCWIGRRCQVESLPGSNPRYMTLLFH